MSRWKAGFMLAVFVAAAGWHQANTWRARAEKASAEVSCMEQQQDHIWSMAPTFGVSVWFDSEGTGVRMKRLEPDTAVFAGAESTVVMIDGCCDTTAWYNVATGERVSRR